MASLTRQVHYKIGDNDNANADLCSIDALDTGRVNQALEAPFMIRIQAVQIDVTPTGGEWTLWYNDTDDIDSAVKVGTALDGTIQVDSVNGLPTNEAALVVDDVVNDNTATKTWTNGEYCDQDATTEEIILNEQYYSDFQYCVKFTALAQSEKTYYFYIKIETIELDQYVYVAQVKTILIPVILGETELCHTITNQAALSGTVLIPECI